MEEELKRTKDEIKDELVALTAKLKEITEKLTAEDLDQDTFDDLMKESQDIFEKITKSFSELSKHKEAEQKEETKLMSQEDKVGGGNAHLGRSHLPEKNGLVESVGDVIYYK